MGAGWCFGVFLVASKPADLEGLRPEVVGHESGCSLGARAGKQQEGGQLACPQWAVTRPVEANVDSDCESQAQAPGCPDVTFPHPHRCDLWEKERRGKP